MKKKILLFSCDPGGSNAIIPLWRPLADCGYEIKLYGKGSALIKYKQWGLSGRDIAHIIKTINQESLIGFLKQEKPDLIITGTSSEDMTDKLLWICGKKLHIPSFAILDQWINYGIRFSRFGLSNIDVYNKTKKHDYLPTRIFVMDEYAKTEMIREGFKQNRIIITGHPYFELVRKKLLNRKKPTNNPSDFVFIFVSEPITESYKKPFETLGYSEISIFESFISTLEQLAPTATKKISVLVKLHPREHANKYKTYTNNRTLKVIIDQVSNPWNLVLSSNLVCGMSSLLLIESVVLGKPIMSIQIGLKGQNPFVLCRQNKVKAVVNKKELKEQLKIAIIDPRHFTCSFPYIQNPIQNVMNQINKQLYEKPCH